MPITDEDSAIAAIATLHVLTEEQKAAQKSIDEAITDVDNPHVDIHALFAQYDTLYFRNLLVPRVEVSWSTRLTLCAGICELVKDEQGKYRRIRLKLSESLLKYRPRNDIINTLLHEAIHAYFFITTSWRHSRGDDGTGHGSGFLLLADAINNHGGYGITVYHTFHDEVESYRTHVWLCNGVCRKQPPYFGLVKRSMNRAPGKSDPWWKRHQEECGGTYAKIMEPELTKKQVDTMGALERAGRQKNKIDTWVKAAKSAGENDHVGFTTSAQSLSSNGDRGNIEEDTIAPRKRQMNHNESETPVKRAQLFCPICGDRIIEDRINTHLNIIHKLS